MITSIEPDVKSVDAMAESNATRKNVTSIRNILTRCEKRAMNEVNTGKKSKLIADVEKLRLEEIEACNMMLNHARDTELGEYYQILGSPPQKKTKLINQIFALQAPIFYFLFNNKVIEYINIQYN